MSDEKSNNSYAVCIKTSELIDEMDDTVGPRLLVGDLVRIHKICDRDFVRCIIQFYDRKTQYFQNALYRCMKENLTEISSDMWPFVHGIIEGSDVKVQMALTGEQEVIVDFKVKFFCEIPPGGGVQFYGLQLMPTPNLTLDNMMELNKIYLTPALSLIILRADNLILNIVNNNFEQELKNVVPDSHEISKPSKITYDFFLTPSSDVKPNVVDFIPQFNLPQSQEQFIIPNNIQQKIIYRTPNLTKENISTDSKSLNMTRFILPKVAENDKTCTTERNCFDCGKSEEDLLIQFSCQHIFCFDCLMISLNDHALKDQYCPFKTQNYNCGYKITIDDLRNILNIANGKSIDKSNSTKRKSLFYKCPVCQFITKTNERDSYECTNCKSLDIQNDIDDEETSSNKTITSFPTNSLTPVETWTCIHCTYSGNCVYTIQCEMCARTNGELSHQKKSPEYYKLLDIEQNFTFMPNFDEFFCIFCEQMIAPNNGITLYSCFDNICLKCIVSYIERQDQAEIKCPHSMCMQLIDDREIKSLLTPETYANHLEKSLHIGKKSIANGNQCCVPDCRGFWEFDVANVKYACPICNTENCIPCKASHPGIECSVFQAQRKT